MPEDKSPLSAADSRTAGWSAGPEAGRSLPESSETNPLVAAAPGRAQPAVVPPELMGHPRYQVLALLGQGGMGAVYKARHLRMDRLVALKVIRPALVTNPDSLKRFQQEVRAAARLAHPNIVTAHDADQAGSLHFLVMEYVEGQSLDEYLRRRGPLPLVDACSYARQAALGLQHAHEKGMVHRDIKPHNLMLTAGGEVKILDFGLARLGQSGPAEASLSALTLPPGAAAAAPQLTGAGSMMGTVDYIAPEQAIDAHSADIRADIYSLGCTLYQLLTGRVVFPGGSLADKLVRHHKALPAPLPHFRPDVPPALVRLVQRMLAKDPAQRPQTPGEVARELAAFTGETASAAVPVARAVEVTPEASVFAGIADDGGATHRVEVRPAALHAVRWSIAAALALLLGVGIAGVWWAASRHPGRPSASPTSSPEKMTKAPEKGPEGLSLSHGREVRFVGHTEGINRVAIGGRLAISGGFDRVPRLWDLTSGGPLKTLEAHPDTIWCVALSPDGRYAATGGQHKAVEGRNPAHDVLRLYDVASGRLVRKLMGHTAVVHHVAFTADSRRLASSSWDGTVRVWDTNGRPVSEPIHFNSPALATAWLPGDKELAVGSIDGNIRVLNVETGRERPRLGGPGDECLAVSPDGRRLLACAMSGPLNRPVLPNVLLLDLSTNRRRELQGHTDFPLSVAFSPDGRRAVSAGKDGTVRLWDVESGRELYCDGGHKGEVHGAVFTPDGRYVLSAGHDAVLRLWPLPAELIE